MPFRLFDILFSWKPVFALQKTCPHHRNYFEVGATSCTRLTRARLSRERLALDALATLALTDLVALDDMDEELPVCVASVVHSTLLTLQNTFKAPYWTTRLFLD